MGWVSQTSYIYGWANGGKPGPGTTVVCRRDGNYVSVFSVNYGIVY